MDYITIIKVIFLVKISCKLPKYYSIKKAAIFMMTARDIHLFRLSPKYPSFLLLLL